MHYASHILIHCIALWCAINDGKAARNAVNPEILANFAKNVASVLSPAILNELRSRNNRSSAESSVLAIPVYLEHPKPNSHPATSDNIVDRTSSPTTNNYERRSHPYDNRLYANAGEGLDGLVEIARDVSPHRRQEDPDFYGRLYRGYNFPPDKATQHTVDADNIRPAAIIEESSSNRYSSYHDTGFHGKNAFGHGPAPAGAKIYGGYHGHFDGPPYGHFHGYHHPYHYGGDHPPANGGNVPEESARLESNGTERPGYGPPYFGNHGYLHHYSPFSYGGYPGFGPHYGPGYRGENDTSTNGRDGHQPYGYHGPYHGVHDLYGPADYGYGHGYGHNYNNGHNGNNNGNNGQAEEPTQNDDQNNSTKNGYGPFGHPFIKPLLGTFHPHGFHPSPFSPLPYDNFHGVFKGGPVAGVGHIGYPIYADPYPIGFPFHYPYGGAFFNSKYNKYLPPKDPDEKAEPPAGELTETENPERITALNVEQVAPAPTSNRYKTSKRKEQKRISLINFENRKV